MACASTAFSAVVAVALMFRSSLTAAQLAPSPAVSLVAKSLELEAFEAVQVCVPFSVVILPTPPDSQFGNYSLAIEAEQAVLEAVVASVENGTLQLESINSFDSSFPIKLVVYLPKDSLTSVAVSSPIAEVTVGPGFDVPILDVFSAFGTGNLNVFNATIVDLGISTSGTGQIYVNGSVTTVTLAAGGTSNVYLLGLEESANVNLGGAAAAVIGVLNASAVIRGVATGVNSVLFNDGICEVESAFLFGAPCVRQNPLVVPTINPQWTCGLDVTGALTCPPGGLLTAAEDASVGLPLGASLPSFLTVPTVTAARQVKPIVAFPARASPPPPLLPIQEPTVHASPPPAIPGTAGSVTTTTPGGTTVSNVGQNQPGGRTAVAAGPGSQTAISSSTSGLPSSSASQALSQQQAQLNSLLGLGVGRRMLQASENAALGALNALLGTTGQAVDLSSASAVPSTLTSTSGPGSIACAFANGQGGCRGSGLAAANNLASEEAVPPPPINTGVSAIPVLPRPPPAATIPTTTSSSAISRSTAGGGPPTTFTSTSGPGAIACSFANGQGGCTPGSPATVQTLLPGTTVFTGLDGEVSGLSTSPLVPSPAPSGAAAERGAILEAGTCRVPANGTLNIFAM